MLASPARGEGWEELLARALAGCSQGWRFTPREALTRAATASLVAGHSARRALACRLPLPIGGAGQLARQRAHRGLLGARAVCKSWDASTACAPEGCFPIGRLEGGKHAEGRLAGGFGRVRGRGSDHAGSVGRPAAGADLVAVDKGRVRLRLADGRSERLAALH